MKRLTLALLIGLAAACTSMAQITTPTSDVLGAHLNYGRGCAACHAPHSGAWGNGANASADTNAGDVALWGQDVSSLYGKVITTGQSSHGTTVVETLPTSYDTTRPDTGGVLTCLSCHDGNYAQGAMMKNQVYEALPATYGTFNKIPTLLGNDGNAKGDYLNDHPVGLDAKFTCGGAYNWDCTNTAGVIAMTGTASSAFVQNYGFFVSLKTYNSTAVVVCTTCHNQHMMNVVKVTNGPKSGLPTGIYATMFFLRAPYNPGTTTAGANQTAQFCRQCHGSVSNEMNGGTTIPTTF